LCYLSSAGKKGQAPPALIVYKVQEDGKLDEIQKIELERPPLPSIVSPDGKFLYLATFRGVKSNKNKKEKRVILKPNIVTYSIAKDGKLTEVARVDAEVAYFFISVDPLGDYLWGMGSKKVIAHKIKEGKCIAAVANAPTDQGAHGVCSDSSGKFIYIPHIGTNQMYQYRFLREKESFEALDPLSVEGPKNQTSKDPRHIVVHPKLNVIYTSNQFRGGISSWKKNAEGKLSLWQTMSTVQEKVDWNSGATDIRLSPDNLFVYISNVDGTNKEPDEGKGTIAAFKVDPTTGELSKCIDRVATDRMVRSFAISASGRYLYAADSRSATIFIYKRNSATGKLTLLKKKKSYQGLGWITAGLGRQVVKTKADKN